MEEVIDRLATRIEKFAETLALDLNELAFWIQARNSVEVPTTRTQVAKEFFAIRKRRKHEAREQSR